MQARSVTCRHLQKFTPPDQPVFMGTERLIHLCYKLFLKIIFFYSCFLFYHVHTFIHLSTLFLYLIINLSRISPLFHLLSVFLSVPQKCAECAIHNSLWLCLVCGHVGCSRQNVDGSGGRGHAYAHFRETHHALAVKLGTVTPDGCGGVCSG